MRHNAYICSTCGKRITPQNMVNKTRCRKCWNERMKEYNRDNKEKIREYARTRRWLNGGPDNRLLGEDIDVGLRSCNGSITFRVR